MKDELEKIRTALEAIGAYDESTREALMSLEDAIDEIDLHPELERIHGVVGETAIGISEREGDGLISKRWHELKDHLESWEEHHPGTTVIVGKVADAFAVIGL